MINLSQSEQNLNAESKAYARIIEILNGWHVPEGRIREHLQHNAEGNVHNVLLAYDFGRQEGLRRMAAQGCDIETLTDEQVVALESTGDMQDKVIRILATEGAKVALAELQSPNLPKIGLG